MNAVFNYDYTASGARKSIEDSLLRMGVQKLDFVFIHDLNPANFGSKEYQKYFEEAKKGYPELAKMKKKASSKVGALVSISPMRFGTEFFATRYLSNGYTILSTRS